MIISVISEILSEMQLDRIDIGYGVDQVKAVMVEVTKEDFESYKAEPHTMVAFHDRIDSFHNQLDQIEREYSRRGRDRFVERLLKNLVMWWYRAAPSSFENQDIQPWLIAHW